MSTDIVNKFRSRSDVETQPGLSDAELGEIEGYIDVKIDAETRDLLKGFVFSYHPFGLVKWNLEDGGEDDYIIPYFYDLRNYKNSACDTESILQEMDLNEGEDEDEDLYPAGVVRPVFFHKHRLLIGHEDLGGMWFIDFDPDIEGIIGQVVFLDIVDRYMEVTHNSYKELLEDIFRKLPPEGGGPCNDG